MSQVPRRAWANPQRTLQNQAIAERSVYMSQVYRSLAPLEDWHTATYDPGWESFGANKSNIVKYRQDNEGFVFIYGRPIYRGGNWGADAAVWSRPSIFTLPENYRPQYRAYLGPPDFQRVFLSSGGARYYWLPSTFVVELDGRVRPLVNNSGTKIMDMQDLLVFRSAPPNVQNI